MEKNISLAKNYFDFNGLNDLKNSAKKNEMKALKETATQFEALFLQMMLKSMRQATPRSELLDSEAIKTYEGMYDREVAISMAGRGSTGIADMLVKQLSRFVDAESTKEILDKRINVNNSFPINQEKSFPLGDSNKKLPLGDYKLNQPMLLPEKNKAFSIRR